MQLNAAIARYRGLPTKQIVAMRDALVEPAEVEAAIRVMQERTITLKAFATIKDAPR